MLISAKKGPLRMARASNGKMFDRSQAASSAP
jgi:hypothetical protein